MKLIDLIELFFKPAPVQFEPVPWRGVPCSTAGEFIMPAEYYFPTTEPGYPLAGWYFHYPNGALEKVSVARVVSIPLGTFPLVDGNERVVGYWGYTE